MATTLPRNADVADQFDLLADLLELEGSDPFRPLAYRRASQRIRESAGSIAELALEGKAKSLQGIGKTIEEKIVQIVETGEIEAITKRKDKIPTEVVLFTRLPGLGPKTAARIWRELDVTTLAGLKEAAEQQRLRTLAGLGARTEERVLAALSQRRHLAVADGLDDLLLDRLADPLELLRSAGEGHLGDRAWCLTDPGRRPPVRRDAEALVAQQLGQVGEQIELIRERGVRREPRRAHHPIIWTGIRARSPDARRAHDPRGGLCPDLQRAGESRAAGAGSRRGALAHA